jgi:hypothetical protein
MADELQVQGKVEQRVILLTIRYGQELLLKTEAHERLSKELTECYRKIREQERPETSSCIVEIQAEVAGSPVVRALFELWKEVVAKEGGQVVCVNYPHDYIDSLTSLGLPSLPGFNLAETKAEAIQQLTRKR